MRNFSKKLAFVLAAAMVFTAFAPAAKAEAAAEMAINRKSQTLYVNEGVNHKGAETLPEGLYGNVCEYDFFVANKPADWKTAYTFDWSSSDEKVMTVGKAGLATAVAPGKADVVCKVTEKATGKTTTLTAAVTVKANAEVVTITNVDDVDGKVVLAGDTVELEYKMLAEDGGEATDLVKWVADPATGVTVEDGVFTFGEDAIPGQDYLLYCQTYQSNKYNQVTATSEKVTVTFATSNTFEVEQNTVKSFTVKFDAPVKGIGDVTVSRLYKGFEVPAVVKTAELAKDGMSATVEFYAALKNNEEYVINIPGYETYKLTASAGAPVEVLLYNNAANKYAEAEIVYIDGVDNSVAVEYRLIDARGVDVTDVVKANGTLLLTAETDEAGNYFVTDDKVWFSKSELEVTVFAEFQMYDNEGNLLTPAKGQKTFVAADKPAVEVLGLADWKVGGDWDKKQQSLPLDETSTIALKVKLSEKVGGNDWVEVNEDQNNVLGGYIRLEELNPEVAALNDFDIVYFKQGTAKILVYYCFKDADGNDDELPIAQLDITAKAATKLGTFTLDKSSVNVGTEALYDEGSVTVSAKTNHGGDCTGYTVAVEGTDDASKAAVTAGGAVAVGNQVKFYGSILKANNNNKAAAQMTFKIKVSKADYTGAVVTLEKNVTVVYKSRGELGTEYIRIEAGKDFGKDVARTAKDADTKAAKTGIFSVYQYSNGIKVGTVDVQPYKADTITTGNYYFKVVKDGKDVTDKVAYAGNVVTVNFSGVDTTDENNPVTYDLGAGNYAISLYEVVTISGKPYARLVNGATAAGAVTCNTGSYSFAGRVADKEDLDGSVAKEDILAMFKFKNAQGGDTLSNVYTVQADYSADNYVYVTSITFYDDLGDGTTAKYVVPIGMALKK